MHVVVLQQATCSFSFFFNTKQKKNKQLTLKSHTIVDEGVKQASRSHCKTFFCPLRTQFLHRFVALENLNRHSRLIPIHLTLFTAYFFLRIIVFFSFFFLFFYIISSSFAEHIEFCIIYLRRIDRDSLFNLSPILIFAPKFLPCLRLPTLILFYLEFSEATNTSSSSSLHGL